VSEKSDRLLGIQAARGVAALLVLLFHVENAFSWILGYVPAGGVFGFGHAGVDFFFVLSGFIIYLVHERDIGQAGTLGRYAWRRAMRIYPLYWLATAVFFAIAYLPGLWSQPVAPGWVAASLLLLPQERVPLLEIGWSLQHEMVFYVVFGLLIANRTAGLVVCAVWLAAIGRGIVVAPAGGQLMDFASAFDLQFFMGMGAAYVVRHWRVATPRLLGALGAGGFALAAWLELGGVIGGGSAWGRLAYGAASMLLVVGLATGERRGLLRFGNWAARFGGMSYALYLFHPLILGLIGGVWTLAGAGAILPGWLLVGGAIAANLLICGWLHHGIETPVLVRLRALAR